MTGTEFDHTSLATRAAGPWLSRVTRELGATVVMGEEVPGFRYVMCRVGPWDGCSGLELMEPRPGTGRNFLSRFLDTHGEGPHHLTFVVPALEETIRDAERLGLRLVQTDLTNPRWRETFVVPDPTHGVVIQIADTTSPAPDVSALATGKRDTGSLPLHRLGSDRAWWEPHVRDPVRTATLVSTTLRSTDLACSHRLFADVLGGHPRRLADGAVEFTWARGTLVVEPASTPGVSHLSIADGPVGGFTVVGTPCRGDEITRLTTDRRSRRRSR
ncbi:hypothetical protein F9278_41945 [Streptomyces phaeolivaceus]|uniref:VOC domain-containing protein n=1 Tax=Streptomyces phaeolivaceus TaxID=2653200 RepID=A0A5P8KEF9_9ACTN|nr:VOC family protein [Streptomyces phaeolivaceus]QFR01666.1 hypothetical protein F9278_41945 [Streptomyces phaeolivaceus]